MDAADDQRGDYPADTPPPDAVDRAAAIDDFFGGFTPQLPDASALQADDGPLPGSLDLLLLLRQAGARGTAPRPSTPATIGRYRIVRLAGRGGFSVVWEAFDPLLRRRVAIKSCSPDALVSAAVRRRFRREAELSSRLSHPHIVTIHEVGAEQDLDYIVTEFCAGGSLADWLGNHPGPVPPRVATRIAEAVAHATAHAHAAGIVHRDIKPGNVMLVPIENFDLSACIIPPDITSLPGMTVKLGDFGLGRLEVPDEGEDPLTQITTDGARLGTPAWMAPEQIDRSFGAVGPATDIHAIGLLLDRMLTGRPLRGGKTDIETYREVLLDEPLPADRVARGVPPDLAAVCLRCLAKRPADRYPSAAALADDLGRWLAGLPTRARPLTPLQRLGRSIARRPLVASLVSAALLATVLAGWAARERSREHLAATAHRQEIEQKNAAAELRRGFESLRSGNVAGALEQIEVTRGIDPTLADSLAARWLGRRLHGERELLLRTPPHVVGSRHRADLHTLAVSEDGRTIAVGGADGMLRILRRGSAGPAIAEIPAHDEINDVALSSDGTLVASVGQDGSLRWWAVDALHRPAGEVRTANGPLYAVVFSRDDSSLYFGGESRVLRCADVASRQGVREVHRCPVPEGDLSEIEAVVPAGGAVIVACGESLTALDEQSDRVLWSWVHHDLDKRKAVFHALAASPDGTLVAAGGSDRSVGLWDRASGARIAVLPPHPSWVQACRFSADGTRLATACRDGIVRVFDASTQKLASKRVGHVGRVWDVAFEPDGSLLSAGADGTLRRWNRPGDASVTELRDLLTTGPVIRSIRDATMPPDGCRLVAVRGAAPPAIIDGVSGAIFELPVTGRMPNDGLAVDRARRRVAFGLTGDGRGSVPIVVGLDGDATASPPAPLPSPSAEVGPYVCWTLDGRLVTDASDGGVYAWAPTLDRVATLGSHINGCFRVESAPAGPPRTAIAARPGVILPCPDRGMPVAAPLALQDFDHQISALAWSPDGRRLVCGFRNGAIRVVDAETGRAAGSLAPHEQQIMDVAWSADGRTILSADAEYVRISDAATFTAFDDLRPGWSIETMCLASDDRFVVIGGYSLNPGTAPQGRLALIDLESP